MLRTKFPPKFPSPLRGGPGRGYYRRDDHPHLSAPPLAGLLPRKGEEQIVKTIAILFCLILMTPILSLADDKTDAVNQQLDMVENEFSNTLHTGDAQKEFPNVQPEGPGIGATLKDIFNPDLSPNPRPKTHSKVITRVHTFDLGPEIFYYSYQEPGVGVRIHGPMYGYFADYAYRPADPNFFNNFLTNVYLLQARYATSRDLQYNGSGVIKGKHDDAMEFRGLVGKDYFVGTDSRVTPYFGFGYRYLLDRGNGQLSNTNNYAYDRKSHYCYLPLGWDAAIEMPKDWEIDLNAEYDFLIEGWQKSFLSDGNQFNHDNNPDIVNDQAHGFGVRGSVKFLKRGPWVDFYVEPYIRFWNIDESKAETAVIDGTRESLVEPKNNTTEIGSRFGIQF